MEEERALLTQQQKRRNSNLSRRRKKKRPMVSGVFPKYVVINILSWLPVKSLVRFKCVSKIWCSLIQKSCFITKHLNHVTLNNLSGGILVKHRRQRKDTDVFFLLSEETFDVYSNVDLLYFNKDWKVDLEMLACCNGIICLHDRRCGQLALWNPATRELRAIPESLVPRPQGLRFNGSNVGFGYEAKTNDFKVVRIICHTDDDGGQPTYHVEIYNLSTDSWRAIDTIFPVSYIMPNRRSRAYLNGCSYWWAKYNIDDETMLSFDMNNELFRTRSLPHDVCNLSTYAGYEKSFAVLNESIALIVFPCEKVKRYEIWVLNEYANETWTKLFTVGPVLGCESPLGFSKDGELFLERCDQPILSKNGNLFLEKHVQLVVYNPLTQQVRELPIEGKTRSLEVLVYKESLVSIMGEKGPGRTHNN